ncbi:uncharacterized protein YALI1_A06174g [Yarrowia lipolytica]|uniref:Uncharacterized protein n=1 Tax=Yarrowia lipolytica TaxID=4952 RepID=A0A1D8N3U2_YARLL|nr:hypothetical protein YALI1_A06174g [Yarrowia lipolytica]
MVEFGRSFVDVVMVEVHRLFWCHSVDGMSSVWVLTRNPSTIIFKKKLGQLLRQRHFRSELKQGTVRRLLPVSLSKKRSYQMAIGVPSKMLDENIFSCCKPRYK